MHDTWGLKAGLPTERPLSCFSRVKYGERASVVASLSLNHATRPQTIAVMSKYGIAVAIARRNLCSRNTLRAGGHLKLLTQEIRSRSTPRASISAIGISGIVFARPD